jgi:mRNA interferase HicA
MESATFRKWLVQQGCHIDYGEHRQRHEGQVIVTVHREGRKTEVPLGGSRQSLDMRVVRQACENLDSIRHNCPDLKAESDGEGLAVEVGFLSGVRRAT